MCGILGGNVVSWNYEKAINSIKHRGPDSQRLIKFTKFVLGFARLSIIDLTDNGMQPMFSLDEEICITFNGEIYGYKKVRKQLEKLGYTFRSTSDTEVIINAYLEYGDNFVDHIDGMFAIAIYDRRIQKIKLYRDRAGIKPLFYFYDNKKFAFASEIKAITNLINNKSFDVDYTAVYDFITYTYIPDPKTLYKNIYKLEPGQVLVFDLNKNVIQEKRLYWKINVNSNQEALRNKNELAEELRYLIDKSIGEQMVADVPLGCFLSGGVDSSIVSIEALKYNPQVETFSIGFTDKKYDELKYAELLSSQFSIRKNQQILDKDNFNNLYMSLKDWYDEPFGDTSAFPTFLVSKLAKEKVTVALTGDGGDEIFGGYLRYQEFKENNIDKGLNSKFVSNLFEKLYGLVMLDELKKLDIVVLESMAKLCTLYGYEQKRMKMKLAKAWNIDKDYDDYWYFRKYYIKDLPPITRMQYLDFNTYLPSDILTKVDRASMQVSLETRVPLLSREIMEFSFSLSEDERCPKGELKGLLKYAYRDILPKQILYRKKMGFGIPDHFIKSNISRQQKMLGEIWYIQ